MRLARREEMRDIDRLAISRHGFSGEQLMENAGRAMADVIWRAPRWRRSRGVFVLCGPGNNGGDGRVIARELAARGLRVKTWSAGEPLPFPDDLQDAGLIVDALFGMGLSRKLDGEWRALVARLNSVDVPIYSVDAPSGLDVNCGVPLGDAVRATCTMTCQLAKPGFFLQQGPSYVGRLVILKVGFPKELMREIARSTFLIGEASARRLLPSISPVANKTSFGRVLIIGGAHGMEGAAILSATAAARAGAGYVTLCSPDGIALRDRPPDFLTLEWDRFPQTDLTRYQAIVVGPGLGTDPSRVDVLRRAMAAGVRTVIDADALTLLSKSSDLQPHRACVLTPHAGELSRLIPMTSAEIEANRLDSARRASLLFGAPVLLKGFRTVVDEGHRSFVIGAGNVALAKAGSGDVLSGFIAGFAAQGLDIAEAAVLGAYVHGWIADQWMRAGRGARTMMASDLPELLATWFRTLTPA